MKIIVRTAGLPRYVIKEDEFEVELPENATMSDLTQKLSLEFPQVFGLRNMVMLVNGVNVCRDFKLHNGDKALFLPVVQGG